MQGSWQRATKDLEDGLFEEGRRTIQKIVGRMKDLVNQEGLERGGEEKRQIQEAMDAVNTAKEELRKLMGEKQEQEQLVQKKVP
jgi:hypothetical protein